MAKVKKINKAQFGDQCKWSGKRGGGVSCGGGGGKSDEYKPGRIPRMSRREERESDREVKGEMLRRTVSKKPPIATAPGIRPGERQGEYRKGSQSFFGGEKDSNEAKYGKKVAKKPTAKRAKVGAKIVKSIKKSIKKK